MDITQILNYSILEVVPKMIKVMILVYLLFKVMDFVTGLLKTWKGVSRYQSKVMRDGLVRWIAELVGIAFVITLDMLFGLDFYLTGFTLALFLYKEGGSIAENLSELGVNMPGIVGETLERFNKDGDKK